MHYPKVTRRINFSITTIPSLIILTALLFITENASGQLPQWVEFNSHESVSKLIQDCDNYWLLRTEHGFTFYETATNSAVDYNRSNLPGLPSNTITDFEISNDNTKWLTSNGDLFRFINGALEKVNVPFTGSVQEINNILIDPYNVVWFSADKLYAFDYNKNLLLSFSLLPYYKIGLTLSPDGTVNYATLDNDTITIKQYKNSAYTATLVFPYNGPCCSFNGIYADPLGGYWITRSFSDPANDGGLIYCHNGITRDYTGWVFGLSLYGYTHFTVDATGNAYLGAYENYGVSEVINIQFNLGTGDILSYTIPTTSSTWYSIDNDHNFWYTQNDKIIKRTPEGSEKEVTIQSNPLSTNYFKKANFDYDGSIWFENNSLIYKFGDNVFTSYTESEIGIIDNNVTCIYNDTKKRTWIGTTNGLYYLNNGNWELVDSTNFNGDNYIVNISEDTDSSILILCKQHLFSFDDTNFLPISVPVVFENTYDQFKKVVSNNHVMALSADQVLYVCDSTGWNTYSESDPEIIDHSILEDFDIDSNGTVWLLTDYLHTDLFKISNQTLQSVASFPDTEIYTMAINRHTGDIWLSANNGASELYKYTYSDNSLVIFNAENSPQSGVGDLTIDRNNNNLSLGSFKIQIYNPNGVIGFDDTINDVFDFSCRINNLPEGHFIEVYPNPVSGSAHVYFNYPTDAEPDFYIYDITAKLIQHEKCFTAGGLTYDWQFDSSGLGRGVYLVAVSVNNKMYSQKFIKL